MKNFGKGMSGALLSLAFVFGIFTATSGIAQAQDRGQHRNDDDNYQRSRQDGDRQDRNQNARRRNRDGNNQADWRRNRDQNRNNGVYGNNGVYRNNGVYGNNGQYGNNGYGRNRGYGNNGGYNQVELQRGYQQGVNTGASDAQRGQGYNPQRSHYFKNASSQVFRQGFVQGYDQGYQQYSGYGNQRNRNGSNSGWGNILGGVLGRP